MKAAVLHAIGDLRIDDIPQPVPKAGEVLIRIGSCGICGSDIPRIFKKGTYAFPTVCGHEFAGTVADDGGGAALPKGTRVTVFPLIWCGACSQCEIGAYHRCANYGYLGSRSNGAFAEYVAAPIANCLPLPDSVSLDEGAMVEPAAVALHALRRGQVTAGDTVAIFGAGPIGLMVAQWARALGAARIVITDIDERSLNLAKSLGFSDVVDGRTQNGPQEVERRTGGRGADVTVEAAGVPATMIAACTAVAPGGRVVMLGNPSADVTLPGDLVSRLMRREATLVGTWNSAFSAKGNPDDWRTVVAAIANKTIDLAPLITHRLPLEGLSRGLQAMKTRSEPVTKVIINP